MGSQAHKMLKILDETLPRETGVLWCRADALTTFSGSTPGFALPHAVRGPMTARLYKFKIWRLTVGIVFGLGYAWGDR